MCTRRLAVNEVVRGTLEPFFPSSGSRDDCLPPPSRRPQENETRLKPLRRSVLRLLPNTSAQVSKGGGGGKERRGGGGADLLP